MNVRVNKDGADCLFVHTRCGRRTFDMREEICKRTEPVQIVACRYVCADKHHPAQTAHTLKADQREELRKVFDAFDEDGKYVCLGVVCMHVPVCVCVSVRTDACLHLNL